MKSTEQRIEEMNNQLLEVWKDTIGFEPIAILASVDNAGSYEKSELHIFKLKRGYALVHENGCSCYESRDAKIDILPNLKAVKESLANGSKETGSYGGLCQMASEKLMSKKD